MENNLQPKVSVIVPIYNVEKYIERCARSLFEQTLEDIEYIFVNDATPDHSMEVLNRVINSYSPHLYNIKIINSSQNKGQSLSRNKGIMEACGKYLLFVDSDDEISHDAIRILYEKAISSNADLVIADNYIVHDGQEVEVKSKVDDNDLQGNENILKAFVEGRWYNVVWNKLVRKSVVIDNNLYFADGKIFEDELWSFQLATVINRMSVVHSPLYFYYIRDNSTMTSNKGNVKWLKFIDILQLMKECIIQNNLQTNSSVGRFFLIKLVQTMSNIKPLPFKCYRQVKSLNCFNIKWLHKEGLLTGKERVAYRHFNLPDTLGFVYFKIIECVFAIKKFVKI